MLQKSMPTGPCFHLSHYGMGLIMPRSPEHTNYTLPKLARTRMVLLKKNQNHLGLGRMDFEMLIFALARLHSADNPFSFCSILHFTDSSRVPIPLFRLSTLDSLPFAEHNTKLIFTKAMLCARCSAASPTYRGFLQ